MWRYKDLPIQRKISIIIVIGMASAMIVTVANFISFDRDNVKRDLIEEMRVLARITAARSAVAVAFGDRSNALENLTALSLRSTIQYACIYDQQYQLFAQFQRKYSKFEGCPDELDFLAGYAENRNPKLLDVMEPIFRKGVRLGYVLVASDLSPIDARTRKWVVTSFFVTIAALFVSFLMTRRMQHSVVKPILDLATLMDAVRNSNDMSLRAKSDSRDEVGRLVDSFNEMLEILGRHNRDLEMLYRGLVEKSAEAEATAASLEVRNQHIKDLFGSAAHDLRQPLQAMSIFVDTLKKKVVDTEQLSIVEKLKQATVNLSHLFTEILDVSRYEFDLSIAGTQPTAIRQLLSKVFLEFEAMAQEKNLTLRFHTLDYKVIAHGALLERIIRNLLSNAIRYTDNGGILLGCRRRGGHLLIEIWDTGRGIPEQKQAQIFSKFIQVNEDDREGRGGFGLGLAIVKQFVDSLGYQLTVSSTVGRGTVFRLRVPLVDEPNRKRNILDRPSAIDRPEESASLSEVALNSLHEHRETRILLVDDDDNVRAAVKSLLVDWGFVVDDFASIEGMLSYYRHGGQVPDLMISDYQLGTDMTGDQAILALIDYLRLEIPAFIISGAENPEIWQEITATGFESMCKPVKPARLRALINHLLQ